MFDRGRSTSRITERLAWLTGGALLGAATMYLADPGRGRHRQQALQEHGRQLGQQASEVADEVAEQAREAAEKAPSVRSDADRPEGAQRAGVDRPEGAQRAGVDAEQIAPQAALDEDSSGADEQDPSAQGGTGLDPSLQGAADELTPDLKEPSDAVLVERVRAEAIGPSTARNDALVTTVEGGVVTLRGQVDAIEHRDDLLERVLEVDGIEDVIDLTHLPDEPAPTRS